MFTAPTADRIRSIVHQHFLELGYGDAEPPIETLLVRNGQFCGRSFRRNEWNAVWFIEENEIKFHDPAGAVVRVIRPSAETPAAQLKAA